MNSLKKNLDLAGRPLTFSIGELAQQATAAVITQYGETTILTTVVVGKENTQLDYFPLNVEYVEKLYAGGRIKGSRWIKREGRPNDNAILSGRLIDRSIRPLFDPSFRRDVQIINTLLSVDGINSPEITAALGTACALSLCSIPFKGPVATVKIGYLMESDGQKGHYVVNPTSDEELLQDFEITFSITNDKVVMIEAEGNQFSEEQFMEAFSVAQKEADRLNTLFKDLAKEANVKPYVMEPDQAITIAKELAQKYQSEFTQVLEERATKEGGSNSTAFDELLNLIVEKYEVDAKEAGRISELVFKILMKKLVLEKKKRVDGRGFDEIRPLSAKVGILPRTHGSAIFSRGSTQVLSIATLGPLSMQQWIENPEGEFMKKYIHHYFMPPYSVGETGRSGFVSRREIGHGALAEKAVEQVLPVENKFPYTVRVVSEVLSSNGSTSMASTCGSSLVLMDAGVPIKEQVGGIAVGIVRKNDDEYQLLTDIIGIEDFYGEMDFKVAGTKNGITAIQLDVKSSGITAKMIKETLKLAKAARLKVLEVMNKAISTPRPEMSKYAPRVEIVTPPEEKIGEIIGPGGKNIKKLIAETGCDIDVGEDGRVSISGVNPQAVKQAADRIRSISKVYERGEAYTGKVIKVLAFGAIVEIAPGKEGLLHVSRMGMGFVKDANEVFKIGDTIKIIVDEIDDKGRLKLKAAEPKKPAKDSRD
ncbi:polyribonucleotide nucleotidyltransferase [Candidatus Roizmanbacteria bacterium RIFOXYB2_FULL_41_10]|uniref:Polyribonucleotide nucleotidyltransferase n=1 Tax=Candidatus Roizmanbacteria bacterium RIFOXYA1_FULL_41_12 TaxID=1802082 RepID=A0A1F7KEZ3_9BACT|nr:MAG: polyribonucleotide nucleotidyltransferase [Candidatus Roizmanbacteria bacterium RIFOXYA1_FULL_41_12]OGK68139.1 MAG: polyribonucleotide nucleotidyltransferase [Candidatus Roizmanbacteria bacterium RIFOXYB1_FULL_41_27]OGK68577.1 MAG: polyribonucleotide nucleotidyltransferase [Candidatus Roizmanbacteria bacterium RIFOXYA2_FULL_41_8]OGK69278.1 MAG: polyribonucleotide nucleotidyltransferase [Candidatus Roizmanbacteria bacterium RIFOXYB2_FULL_41_10]OGK71925.1 MAG: polyribonucleotide nucleotid